MDLASFFGDNNTSEESETDWSFSEKFKKIYYDRLLESYVYYPEIYGFITSGKEVKQSDFLSNLEEAFKIKDGKVNPAHELLNSFMQLGYWSFTNEEFNLKLRQLLSFAENAEYEDITSYLNAGIYILGYKEIISESEKDVIAKIKKGLTAFMSSRSMDERSLNHFDLIFGNFQSSPLKELLPFIQTKLKEYQTNEAAQQAIALENLFAKNLIEFIESISSNTTTLRYPDKPLFHIFKKEVIFEAVKKWQPNEIMHLSSYLKTRYLKTSFSDRLIDELAFLKNLEDGIKQIDLTENKLSNKLIQSELLPIIEECKKKLIESRPTSFLVV